MRVADEDLVLIERGLPKHHMAPLWRSQVRSAVRCLSCGHHPHRTKRGRFEKSGLDARVWK